jgi:hypothetical protein
MIAQQKPDNTVLMMNNKKSTQWHFETCETRHDG